LEYESVAGLTKEDYEDKPRAEKPLCHFDRGEKSFFGGLE
jgi:hypothetical protein